jgi:hypothetical protein
MSDRFPTGYAVLRSNLVEVLDEPSDGPCSVRYVQTWRDGLPPDERPVEADAADLDTVRDRDDLLVLASLHSWTLDVVKAVPFPARGAS